MPGNKDYYQILGVSKTASPEDIKQAYRKLAREHHPDMVKGADKTTAEQRFKEINEAYQVLSDPQKRKMFDQYGSAAFSGGAQNAGAQGFGGFNQGQWGPFTYSYTSGGSESGFGSEFDPFDVFEQFFGFRGFGGQARQPRKGKNLAYELKIEFADAVFGLEKEIKVQSGNVTIKIPAGVRDGMEFRFPERGMPGPQGAQNGDLFISVRIAFPKEFEIYDEHILIKKELTFTQAILGDVIDVQVVDLTSKTGLGITKLKIPEGTQYGTKFLIRGKGMPRFRGRGQGDVVVHVFITMPKRLSREQKTVLEQYRKL